MDKKLHLKKLIKQNFKNLSLGQKQLILIACAVVKTPDVLILDEPTNGLDRENKKNIIETLWKICESGKTTLLFITHKSSEILPYFTHQLVLEKGKVVTKGVYEKLIS